ncbi:FAD-dependent oxidoreductase [Anaerotignum faecicola]|nr:FAD-dependent oxidoreductase [Anaerotignum faecicola]
MKVIVAGGGWAGCAAAYEAAKSGAETTILERADKLLGTGLSGGIMRNNGRLTAEYELTAMGGGKLFEVIDRNIIHRGINFPGHLHADLYCAEKMYGDIERLLLETGVEIKYFSRLSKAVVKGMEIIQAETDDGTVYKGDVFIDATGSAGPCENCIRYGNGCASCLLRCHDFGGRISLSALAGASLYNSVGHDGGFGAMSGSCKIYKRTLSSDIVRELDENGFVVIPVPIGMRENHINIKACRQYSDKSYAENLILLDTGEAKLMCPYFPLKKLRRIKGFENAVYEDPQIGGNGNSMRFFDMVKRDNAMKADNVKNLFAAGEKAGPLVGHTEAIVTGTIAGHNAVLCSKGLEQAVISRNTAIGEAIAYVNDCVTSYDGLKNKYTFSGSVLLEHLNVCGLYTSGFSEIKERVRREGLENIF